MEPETRVRLGLTHAQAALVDCMSHLGLVHDQVRPVAERVVLDDVRWHAAEAYRLLRRFRVAVDRSGASLLTPPHDPPPADVGAAPPPEEPPRT